MNDLNTISRLNAEAAERDIAPQLKAGKYVVAEYTGLHYVAHHVFDTEDAALEKQEAINGATNSSHAKLLRPE